MAKKHADSYQVNLMMADLHSFSTPIDYGNLQAQIKNNLRVYAAAGLPLDNPDIRIFRESFVPAHSELMHILDCFTGVGEMSRMTQFKDKAAKIGNDRVSVALFNYPPLMAADILLYGASYVPVGEDQTQHLEFTRDIAERLNNQFGELFVVPKNVKEQHEFFGKDQGLRIRDLVDPTKKMSKSDDTGKGVVFLSDSPEVARKKIMSSTTDSLANQPNPDFVNRPGVANLVQIFELLAPESAAKHKVESYSYKEYKELVADALCDFLEDFQRRLSSVDEAALMKKVEASEAAMNEQAGATLLKVQKAVGLR